MTRFRLNAGRPAAYSPRGGSSARSEIAAEVACIKCVTTDDGLVCQRDIGGHCAQWVKKYWAPNTEPRTFLTCGDSIPWPVLRLIGSGKDETDRQVWCDQHGWRHVIRKEDPQCKTTQPMLPDNPPF